MYLPKYQGTLPYPVFPPQQAGSRGKATQTEYTAHHHHHHLSHHHPAKYFWQSAGGLEGRRVSSSKVLQLGQSGRSRGLSTVRQSTLATWRTADSPDTARASQVRESRAAQAWQAWQGVWRRSPRTAGAGDTGKRRNDIQALPDQSSSVP